MDLILTIFIRLTLNFCKQVVLLFQCCPNIAKSCVLLSYYGEKNFNVLPRGTFINIISILDEK